MKPQQYEIIENSKLGNFKAGEIVWRFDGATYGCIADGLACSRGGQHKNPSYEVPWSKLRAVSPPSEPTPAGEPT